jgi:hypothetical protein
MELGLRLGPIFSGEDLVTHAADLNVLIKNVKTEKKVSPHASRPRTREKNPYRRRLSRDSNRRAVPAAN